MCPPPPPRFARSPSPVSLRSQGRISKANAKSGDLQDTFGGLGRIMQNLGSGDADDLDALDVQPGGSACVLFGIVGGFMHSAVDLDRQLGWGAEEVEDVGTDWVLAAEVRAARHTLAKVGPQGRLGRRHRAAETSCAFLGKDRRSHD